MAFTPASVLIYTDGEVIGDGIIRLPFAAALKKAFPGIHITWLASGYSVYATSLAELAKPYIDEVLIIPHRDLSLGDFLFGPEIVRGRRFDLIIDAQRKVKRTLWLKRIRHARLMSSAANGLLSAAPATRHARFIDQITALAEAATGVTLEINPLPLPSTVYAERAAQILPEGRDYIGFIIGAGHPDKCWPLDRFMAIAAAQAEAGRVPVIFLGPAEHAQAETIRAQLPNAILPEVKTPYDTITLASRLRAAIANDSGGGHLLAAGGCPLVSLFRSSTVREKFMPSTRVIALAPEDFGGVRMVDIPEDGAEKALNELLN